jgi:hypothetical protein
VTTRTTISAAAVAALLLTACSEEPQTAQTRKSDTRPWETAQNAYLATGFKPGDPGGWEQQMRQRAQGQNEYTRVQAGPK